MVELSDYAGGRTWGKVVVDKTSNPAWKTAVVCCSVSANAGRDCSRSSVHQRVVIINSSLKQPGQGLLQASTPGYTDLLQALAMLLSFPVTRKLPPNGSSGHGALKHCDYASVSGMKDRGRPGLAREVNGTAEQANGQRDCRRLSAYSWTALSGHDTS